MPRRAGTIAIRLITILIVSALSIEIGLRARTWFQSHQVFEEGGLFRYAPHTQAGASPEYTTNNYGFFGPDMATPKPAGEIRVFVLGSSAVTSPQLARRLQEELRGKLGESVVVNTAGMPRYTSYHNAVLAERYIAQLAPDWIIFYGGLNDNVYNTFPEFAPIPYDGFIDPLDFGQSYSLSLIYDKVYLKRVAAQRHFDPAQSSELFHGHLERIADAAPDAQVLLVPIAVGWPTGDADLSQVIRANEGPMSHFWGDLDSAMRGRDAHEAVMKGIAAAHERVRFCDIDTAFTYDAETFHDLCHLTPSGIDTLAKSLATCIAP